MCAKRREARNFEKVSLGGVRWTLYPFSDTSKSMVQRILLAGDSIVHFHHKQRKSSKELWTQPRDADYAPYHTTEVWLHRDATRPLQRFSGKL
jgi:hypothetical protein